MTHWHVTRHSEDDDPYVTENLYEALDHAGTELDRLADFEHDMTSAQGDAGDFEGAYRSFQKTEVLNGLQANAKNIVKQHTSAREDRAPLYQMGPLYEIPADDLDPESPLYVAALHTVQKISEESEFSIWSCDQPTAYVTDTYERTTEDDPNANLTCETYL